jgi:peptidoglycan/xylan/chitin deacetylase (PgdA/CDA1 family)
MASLLPGPPNTAEHIRRSGLKVIFPFYHAVSNGSLPHTLHLYKSRSLAQFENDLDYLGKYFTPVKMSDFLEEGFPKDRKKPPLVLSFDDGLVQCYGELMPVLLKKGIPATFFLNNDFIDNKGLFFRFKVSLLLEHMSGMSAAELKLASDLLQCSVSDLRKRVFGINYPERDLTEQVAKLWSYSYSDYLSSNPVYLSTGQINEMIGKGFEFGAHGFDHPHFASIPAKESIEHIRQSLEDLQIRFKLDYRYFAFPFSDSGVKDNTIEDLFKQDIIDAGFGTAGLKDDRWKNYYQRVPMELGNLDALRVLRGELIRRSLRLRFGKNTTAR